MAYNNYRNDNNSRNANNAKNQGGFWASNLTGKCRIKFFDNTCKTSLFVNDEDSGEKFYFNYYVGFRKGKFPEPGEDGVVYIMVKDGFLTCFGGRTGKTYPKLVVLDWEYLYD